MTPKGWRGAWRALSFGAGLALAAGVAVLAQPSGNQTTGGGSGGESGPPASETPPGVPVIQAPPETEPPASANVVASAPVPNPKRHEAATNAAAAQEAEAKPPAPPPPPRPVRSPAAIIQALDKVTAETMRFAAPVGKPVRYKNLVFVVKACESTGLGGPSPNASAYMVVDNAPPASEGVAAPSKQVFKGWMFANSPGLNPLQSPIYDAWLIACMAAPPPT
jgi:hypothetical protein